MTEIVRAAGGVVWRRDSATQVLLVHRPRYDDWTFPKGKADPGEADEACAIREVEEETGLHCVLEAELRATEYVDMKGRPKRVRWWRMQPVSGDGSFRPNDEVDELRWCTSQQALDLLSYDRDRSLLDALTLVVLRHARAGDRRSWAGDDRARPLDERGVDQARLLVEPLRTVGPTAIVSSPTVRCVQTVEPLAAELGLEIETSDALAEETSRDETLELVRAAGPGTVFCTHGNVVELLLEAGLRKGAAALVELTAPSHLRVVGSVPAPER